MGINEQTIRQLRNRLRRAVGQLEALSNQLDNSDPLLTLTQIEAGLSAVKGFQREYLLACFRNPQLTSEEREKLIERMVR